MRSSPNMNNSGKTYADALVKPPPPVATANDTESSTSTSVTQPATVSKSDGKKQNIASIERKQPNDLDDMLRLISVTEQFCTQFNKWMFVISSSIVRILTESGCNKFEITLYGSNICVALIQGITYLGSIAKTIGDQPNEGIAENIQTSTLRDVQQKIKKKLVTDDIKNIEDVLLRISLAFDVWITMLSEITTSCATMALRPKSDSTKSFDVNVITSKQTAANIARVIGTMLSEYESHFQNLKNPDEPASVLGCVDAESMLNVFSKIVRTLDDKPVTDVVLSDTSVKRNGVRKGKKQKPTKALANEKASTNSDERIREATESAAKDKNDDNDDDCPHFCLYSEFASGATNAEKYWRFDFDKYGATDGPNVWKNTEFVNALTESSDVDRRIVVKCLQRLKVYAVFLKEFGDDLDNYLDIVEKSRHFSEEKEESESEIVALSAPLFFWLQMFMCMEIAKKPDVKRSVFTTVTFLDEKCEGCGQNMTMHRIRTFYNAYYSRDFVGSPTDRMAFRLSALSSDSDFVRVSGKLSEIATDFSGVFEPFEKKSSVTFEDICKVAETMSNLQKMTKKHETKWFGLINGLNSIHKCKK